jgi:3-oxoacyl-[acyl-carrier-protein] synthase II
VRTTAVTGWAWRTPLGHDVDEVVRLLANGARAAAPLSRFPTEAFDCRWAATIVGEPAFTRHRRFLRRMGCFALEVAREAAEAARLTASGDRLGLFFGYGGLRAHWNDMMPALARQQPDGAGAWERGLALLHPFWMLQHLSNNAHALAAEELSARGDGLLLAGANAGAQALSAAARALDAGVIDAAIVVATDTLLEPETLVELATRGAFTGSVERTPPAPYDARAAGFVPGEAAAAVVLERRADAGARARAFVDAWEGADAVVGTATGSDLVALTNVFAAIPRLTNEASPADIVDGAALGSVALDTAERRLLTQRPDLVASDAALVATLGGLGQLGAASSVVQTISLAARLRHDRFAPRRAGLALSTGAPGLAATVRVEVP